MGTFHILGALSSGAFDRGDSGAVAAQGMSEVGYSLPAEQVKALGEASSNAVPRSHCGPMLAKALRESAKSLVEKRCGDFAALEAKIASAPPDGQATAMVTACHLADVTDKDLKGADPWAVLMSTIVADELSAQPQSNEGEKKVAGALVNLCWRALH